MVYAKPPFGGPDKVLAYLGRYTHRAAISNACLLSLKDGRVTFRYKRRSSDSDWHTITLDVLDLRQFAGHVLPNGVCWRTDSVAVVLMLASPKPIIPMMGGIEHSEADKLLIQIASHIIILGVMLFPFWLIGSALLAARAKPRWTPTSVPVTDSRSSLRQARWLAWTTVLVWAVILPSTQAEQRLAWQVGQALGSDQIDQAVALMSNNPRTDFPPVFDPRPKLWAGRMTPDPWQVLDVALDSKAPTWVIDLYARKAEAFLGSWVYTRPKTPEQARHLLSALPRLPDGPRIAAEHLEDIGFWIAAIEQTDEDVEAVKRIQEMAQEKDARR